MIIVKNKLNFYGALEMEKSLITVGTIARETGIPIATVQYILYSRGIAPDCRAGRLRVFSEKAIDRVRAEYNNIHGKK